MAPDEATKPLPGDELVQTPRRSTRAGSRSKHGQSASGRGSCRWATDVAAVQHRPARHAREERRPNGEAWQDLATGDVVPSHPGGGFQVKVLEPNRASSSSGPVDDAAADPSRGRGGAGRARRLGQLRRRRRASSRRRGPSCWTRWTGPGYRAAYLGAEGTPVTKAALSLLGFGVFVMMQRQMTGIRSRAERLTARPASAGLTTLTYSEARTSQLPDRSTSNDGPRRRPAVRLPRTNRTQRPLLGRLGRNSFDYIERMPAPGGDPAPAPTSARLRSCPPRPSPAPRRARLVGTRAKRPAVGDLPLLRHPRHDGRRHQPRGGGARLRHPPGDRGGGCREPARRAHPLHEQLRDVRASQGAARHLERLYGVAYDPRPSC